MTDNTDVPAVMSDFARKLMSGIADSRASTILSGSQPFLRMLKGGGGWVYGQESIEVQEGSRWVVNVMSLQHGWCCWVEGQGKAAKNELKGEVMVSMTEGKPACPPPIGNTEYKEQRSFGAKCIDGEDAGEEVVFKTNSDGGLKAVDKLLAEIHARIPVDPVHICPVLTLKAESYDHPKWGQTWKPIFQVVGWSDMHGNLAGAKPAVAAPARPIEPIEPIEPTAAPKPPPPPPPPAAVTGQRRRPAVVR